LLVFRRCGVVSSFDLITDASAVSEQRSDVPGRHLFDGGTLSGRQCHAESVEEFQGQRLFCLENIPEGSGGINSSADTPGGNVSDARINPKRSCPILREPAEYQVPGANQFADARRRTGVYPAGLDELNFAQHCIETQPVDDLKLTASCQVCNEEIGKPVGQRRECRIGDADFEWGNPEGRIGKRGDVDGLFSCNGPPGSRIGFGDTGFGRDVTGLPVMTPDHHHGQERS
jgi:hypothetical protein